MVDEWENGKVCTRRELESFIGILQHACKVIRPGRSFLRPGNSTAQNYKAATSSQHGIQVRPIMVEGIRGPLEWASCHGDI